MKTSISKSYISVFPGANTISIKGCHGESIFSLKRILQHRLGLQCCIWTNCEFSRGKLNTRASSLLLHINIKFNNDFFFFRKGEIK